MKRDFMAAILSFTVSPTLSTMASLNFSMRASTSPDSTMPPDALLAVTVRLPASVILVMTAPPATEVVARLVLPQMPMLPLMAVLPPSPRAAT